MPDDVSDKLGILALFESSEDLLIRDITYILEI